MKTPPGERLASPVQGIRMSWWRRRKKLLVAAGVVLGLVITGLGWYSYNSTHLYVDGFAPGWVLQVSVKDERGQPVEGATLVLRNRRRPADPMPDDQNHCSQTSGPDGQVAHRRFSGCGMGGSVRRLFWLIPVNDLCMPEFDCEVACPGYKTVAFPFDALHDPRQRTIVLKRR